MSDVNIRAILASSWINLVGYQLVWFIAVAGAGRERAWPGVIAMVVFAAWQLMVSRHRRLDLSLIATAFTVGVVLDGLLAASGLLRYAAAAPALPPGGAPLWILALWISFALTITRSLAWLKGRTMVAAVLGAVGAPLAYLGAARGWDAVEFAQPAWQGLLCLAVGWAVAVPLLSGLSARWSDDPAGLSAWKRCAR